MVADVKAVGAMPPQLVAEINAACPTWDAATLLLTSQTGDVAGYGTLARDGTLTVSASPEAVRFLSPSPQSVGA
jgi:hypothetical protein